VKSGGVLKDYHKVTEIVPGERVTVKTNHGDFSARRVIITAGPWTPKIMKQLGVDLPITVSKN
jgi:glycine/D-amino acid oxidase-like deaminating enzyme